MANATVSAVRPARALLTREAALGAAAALAVGTLAAADGGYFPSAWGWAAIGAAWLVATGLVAATRPRLDRLDVLLLGGLSGLAFWTWLSGVWSDSGVQSILEGHRMLLYVLAAGAALLFVRNRAAGAVVGGVLVAVLLVSGYALATRLFPDRLGAFDPVAGYRLSEPLGYWNALGILGAMGAALALGVVARARTPVARALGGAALPLLLATVYYTFGRGPWIALGLALLAALVLDPRRLQLVAAALAVAPPAALAVWLASRPDALRRQDAPLAEAAREGHRLALLLLGLAAAGALLALAFAAAERRLVPGRAVRLAFAAGLAGLLVAVLGGVFLRYGGPVTIIEKGYDSFTAPPPELGVDVGERLFTFSGSYRPDVWEVAWDGYREHPVLGLGAGTYEQYWLSHRTFDHKVRDAHSLYVETLAELGPVGLALLLVALLAPVAAAVRARRHPLAVPAFAGYVAYLVHAGADWDWEMPALTVAALLLGAVLLALAREGEETAVSTRVRTAGLVAALGLATVAFVGLLGASAIAASDEAADAANWQEAEDEARRATRWAFWSSEPWQRLGEAQLGQGDLAGARASFRKAVAKEPSDWELWLDVARASTGAERELALAQATRLNPLGPEVQEVRDAGS